LQFVDSCQIAGWVFQLETNGYSTLRSCPYVCVCVCMCNIVRKYEHHAMMKNPTIKSALVASSCRLGRGHVRHGFSVGITIFRMESKKLKLKDTLTLNFNWYFMLRCSLKDLVSLSIFISRSFVVWWQWSKTPHINEQLIFSAIPIKHDDDRKCFQITFSMQL
jgi:hypothetical protein